MRTLGRQANDLGGQFSVGERADTKIAHGNSRGHSFKRAFIGLSYRWPAWSHSFDWNAPDGYITDLSDAIVRRTLPSISAKRIASIKRELLIP